MHSKTRNREVIDRVYKEAHDLSMSKDKYEAAQGRCLKKVALPILEFILQEKQELGYFEFTELILPILPMMTSYAIGLILLESYGPMAPEEKLVDDLSGAIYKNFSVGLDNALETYKERRKGEQHDIHRSYEEFL